MGGRSQLEKVAPAADRGGKSLCGWTVERLLGVGPVCESWLAVQGKPRPDPAQRAVLRILREPFAGDGGARAEWLRASWAANRFSHARVPRVVLDGADADGAPLVVRVWAQGRSLEEVVRGGVLGVDRALRLAEQILDALEMAHAHRVIHGALTPTNVIVTDRWTARLVDFAVAPGSTGARAGVPAAVLRRAHVSPYTAPEREATEAADVWSAGACLYFALSGQTPSGPSPTLRRIQHRSARDAQALAAVVGRALAADPAERYPSAYAMLGDVRRVLAGRAPRLGASVTPVSSQRSALPDRSSSQRPRSARDVSGSHRPPLRSSARLRDTSTRGEWRGNLLLFLAVALAAAVAAYVVARERLAEPPDPPPALTAPPS